MTDWLAPAVEAESAGKFVPCELAYEGRGVSRKLVGLEWLGGPVGFGAAVVVRFAKGDVAAANRLARELRENGYQFVQTKRAKR